MDKNRNKKESASQCYSYTLLHGNIGLFTPSYDEINDHRGDHNTVPPCRTECRNGLVTGHYNLFLSN